MGKLEAIFKTIDQNKLLIEWKAKTDLEQYANYFGFYFDEEESSAIEDFELEYDRKPTSKELSKILREILEEKATDYFFERLDEIGDSISRHLEMDGDQAVVYREITVADDSEFMFYLSNGLPIPKYDGIGIFWSFHKHAAQAHWGDGAHDHSLLLKGLVSISDVDFKTSILLNLDPSIGADESEIRLREGAMVQIIEVNEEIVPAVVRIPV